MSEQLLLINPKAGTEWLHIDPSDQAAGSSVIIDKTGFNSVQKFGNVVVSDDGPKPGMKSVRYSTLPSGRNYTYCPYYAGQPNMLTGDFTVEFWFRRENTGPTMLFAQWVQEVNRGGWYAYLDQNSTLIIGFGPYNENVALITASQLPNNNWYHICLCRKKNDFYLFINGNLHTKSTTSVTRGSIGAAVCMGVYQKTGGAFPDTISVPFVGNLADMRLIQGYAKHTSNFTP